jgi:aspartate carbamoyltransferase regulatory subunit
MTVRLEVRFRHPIIIEQEITATSEKINDKGKFIQAKGVLKIEDGTIAADAIGTFAYVPEKTLTKITKDYPLLAKEWMI